MSIYEIIGVAAGAASVLAVVITILAGMFRIMYRAGIHKNKIDQNTANTNKLESFINERYTRIETNTETLRSSIDQNTTNIKALDFSINKRCTEIETNMNKRCTEIETNMDKRCTEMETNMDKQFVPIMDFIKQFNTLTEQSKGEEGLARTLQASPLEIAVPEGIEAKNLMQIDAVIERLYAILEPQVMSTHPNNAYDVQSRSLQLVKEHIIELLTEEELTRLKDYAYNTGIPITGYTGLFGLVLRDKILRQHKISLPPTT